MCTIFRSSFGFTKCISFFRLSLPFSTQNSVGHKVFILFTVFEITEFLFEDFPQSVYIRIRHVAITAHTRHFSFPPPFPPLNKRSKITQNTPPSRCLTTPVNSAQPRPTYSASYSALSPKCVYIKPFLNLPMLAKQRALLSSNILLKAVLAHLLNSRDEKG